MESGVETEPIEAEWQPIVDARPPRRVTWVDVWRGSPWLITICGTFCALCLIAFLWTLLTN